MQYDSLGYLVCWSLLYSGQYSFAVYLLDNTLKFFNINYKEVRLFLHFVNFERCQLLCKSFFFLNVRYVFRPPTN